ncbi:hypothetical protein CTAYLR_008752 [Chrysophaeum taylorii]|uniref:SET domain-containing protein n=1 Tax=Chrysophaeum taylorii TaxID=2483200 RepID=A0AAD7UDK6_9STRA|nr:hypothetical protein CTAYLR_008752 [Chrysophaeum taylorii]
MLIVALAYALDLQKLGLEAPRLRVRANPVRGLEASRHIRKGDEIASVPRSLAIEVNDIPDDRGVEGLMNEWQRLPWEARLAARLLDSKSEDWRRSMPQTYDLPIDWDDDDLGAAYEPLARAVDEQRRARVSIERKLGVFPAEEVRWALATVQTRSFSGRATSRNRFFLAAFVAWLAVGYVGLGGDPANAIQGAACAAVAAVVSDVASDQRRHVLAPGLDLLNHSGSCDATVSYEYFADRFALVADRDYDEGEEVFASYGKKSNSDLLATYGFVEKNNPHDTYVVPRSDTSILAGATLTRAGFPEAIAHRALKISGNDVDNARAALARACDDLAARLEEDDDDELGGSKKDHRKLLLQALRDEHATLLRDLARTTRESWTN